jgi:hypothetical protein
MAARTGMSNLIKKVRSLCNIGTADYTVNGESYWTDDQVEDVLDRHAVRIQRELLEAEGEWQTGGTVVYVNYRFKETFPEEAGSGTAIWTVQNGAGSVIGTANYAVNYEQRRISFTADQEGEARYLNYYSFDPYRAAAEIWEEKAGHVADRFDVETDNHNLKRSQLHAMYMQRARDMLKKAKIGKVGFGKGRQVRSDLA